MSEQLPNHPEQTLSLQYHQGWQEILEAPDAESYRTWIGNLMDMTRQAYADPAESPSWVLHQEALQNRWQRAIEVVAEGALEADGLTEAERIETGLLTIKESIESMGWEEEGLAFLAVGSEPYIDLRELRSFPDENSL